MIYLDNAATTFPKPECVYKMVDSIQRTIAVNVGRGNYHASSEAMKIVDETKVLMAQFVGAADSGAVIFTPSATIASNEIVLGLDWNELRNVYVTPFEHNSIARPVSAKCDEFSIKVRQIPFERSTHSLNIDQLQKEFTLNPPDFVFLNHVSNVTGTVIPVEYIAQLAKEYNADAVVVVDGSQSVGLMPINLKESDIDFLIFAGHKNLYASWGVGGFIRNSKYPLKPVLVGGTGSDSLNLHITSDSPGSFEPGSPNIIAIASLHASLEWLYNIGISKIAQRKSQLMERLIKGLREYGVNLYLPAEGIGHTSVLSFNLANYEADEVGQILDQDFDIAVRTGYHCAPYVHRFLGTEETHGTVRVSLSYFNTEDDIDSFVKAISEM